MNAELKKFIGDKIKFENGYIYSVRPNGHLQPLAEVRGYGAIQNLFKAKDGSVDFERVDAFQDKLGEVIAQAIHQFANKELGIDN